MSDYSHGKARGGRRGGRADDRDRGELPILPPESRGNEKTDILPAVNVRPEPRREEYSSRRHPVWIPAPTTIDHGPPNMPGNRLAIAAKLIVVFLIMLALAGAMLLLLKSF
jgi:hypothetical protein